MCFSLLLWFLAVHRGVHKGFVLLLEWFRMVFYSSFYVFLMMVLWAFVMVLEWLIWDL